MSLIDKFQTDFSKFFNDEARRGDSLETQLQKSSLSINLFSTEAKLLSQLQDSLNITSNATFETSPIEAPDNGIGVFSTSAITDLPFVSVNQSFPTSPLEESPTQDVGSVNFFSDDMISGFTQFMDYPDTLYPTEGLNNSGIVDNFPNPHNYDGDTDFQIEGFTANMPKYETLYPLEGLNNSGVVDFFPNPHNYDGDTDFQIEGFTADMQKYETLYPSKDTLELSGINSGIVDFFPSPHGIGHFGVNDVPHDIEGFVANVQPLSDGFYPNTIELSSVDFFPGGNFSNNFVTSTGFTQDAEPFGGNKIETEFKMIGEGNVLNQDFMNNELFQSVNTLGTYKGAVDFFSDTDSYATGFTKNMQPIGGDKLDTQYDISTYYTDTNINQPFPTEGFSVTSGTPSPSVTTYPTQGSIFTSIVDVFDDEGDPIGTDEVFSVYSLGKFQLGKVAGMGERGEDPFSYTDLLGTDTAPGMMSWNVDGFNYGITTNGVGDNVAGYTQGIYPIVDGNSSQFTFLVNEGQDIKLSGINYNGQFSDLSIGYASIPSLSIPRPVQNVDSGFVSVSSGFTDGDFKLTGTDSGDISRYLQTSGDNKAAEGSIVRDASELNIRIGTTTLSTLFNDGEYDENGGLGTKYRNISNMDEGMAQTQYATGYGDGINDGWMKGLISKSVPLGESFSGNTADFFVRESSGGRFLGRIGKDLLRYSKFLISGNGLLSMAKNAVLNLDNMSEKSFNFGAPAHLATLIGSPFGLRTTSAFSGIFNIVQNAFGFKSEDSLYYEERVNKAHPEGNLSGNPFADAAGAALAAFEPSKARTLKLRYGQPSYPKRSTLGKKPTRAHKLYATGMLDPKSTRGEAAIDKINIVSYGEGPGGIDDSKDLIKFNIRDIRNGKYIVLRAFLTNIQDSVSPEWNNYRYVGRPDDVYVYKGTTRSVSFSLKVAAFSRREMIPMWEKINYLVGLNYGSYVDVNESGDGQYYQYSPGMTSPICELTLGDYLTSQPGYIKDFNISVPPEYPWDTIIDDNGSNVIGELPQVVDINMGFQVIPQQIPDSYGKHFGKVGLGTDNVTSEGLPWLKDLYTNVPALKTFDEAHKKYIDGKITLPPGEENDTDTTSEEASGETKQKMQDEAEKAATNA